MKTAILALGASAVLASCATASWPTSVDVSVLSNAPASFRAPGVQPGNATALGVCANPLEDPTDGTRITLVRSSGGFGDYAAQHGRYGLGPNQLLRVNCSNGQPVGAVQGAP